MTARAKAPPGQGGRRTGPPVPERRVRHLGSLPAPDAAVEDDGAAAVGRRAVDAVSRVFRGQPALQETVGQVELPLRWIVTPQLLPLPLGLAVSTWALG